MPSAVTALRSATQRHVLLLDADRDLASFIPSGDHAAASQALSVPEAILDPGPFEPQAVYGLGRAGFGALIVSGLITREVSIDGRPVLRLLGPGML
jgi:hypothetical protein